MRKQRVHSDKGIAAYLDFIKIWKDCEKFGLYAKEIGFDLQKLYQYKRESVS